jgi:hypothetical protein
MEDYMKTLMGMLVLMVLVGCGEGDESCKLPERYNGATRMGPIEASNEMDCMHYVKEVGEKTWLVADCLCTYVLCEDFCDNGPWDMYCEYCEGRTSMNDCPVLETMFYNTDKGCF